VGHGDSFFGRRQYDALALAAALHPIPLYVKAKQGRSRPRVMGPILKIYSLLRKKIRSPLEDNKFLGTNYIYMDLSHIYRAYKLIKFIKNLKKFIHFFHTTPSVYKISKLKLL
jgi:hypothetical protein